MTKQKHRRKSTKRRSLYLPAGGILLVILVAVAAFLATRTNTPTTTMEIISPSDYQSQFVAAHSPHLLLDVRTAGEFASGHIPGAVNIPVESLQSRLSEVSDDQPIVVYCRSGNRSAEASQILAQAGYTSIYDLGGLIDWTAQGLPVE